MFFSFRVTPRPAAIDHRDSDHQNPLKYHPFQQLFPLILQLPSAVIGGDYNFIINPLHPFHSQIKVMRETPFHYDERLQKIDGM